MSVCPENLGKWSSPPQNESELSPRSIQSYFPHLQGPSCRKSPSTFFRSKWVKYDYSRPSDGKNVFFDPIGDCNQSYKTQLDLKSADHDFLQMGPWRRGKQFWIDLGESSDSFWGGEDQFPTFSRQNLMRTYWKVLFQRAANPTTDELACRTYGRYKKEDRLFVYVAHTSWEALAISSPRIRKTNHSTNPKYVTIYSDGSTALYSAEADSYAIRFRAYELYFSMWKTDGPA